ncbi:MAG: hypothetical protein SF123_20810 [Chloroflexota bacterium]|nr:hypothetical protein [Chloroflexota bacterium]
MAIDWGRVLPVIVSILIILLVAVLRDQSRVLAVILATMPINIPLALWVISSGSTFQQTDFVPITRGLIFGLIPALAFTAILYFAARAGWSLVPMLAAGYAGWAIMLLIGYALGFFRF